MDREEKIRFILSRRSIREYTTDPVAPEEIQTLLEAAMSAPSASDKRPWHFIVITDRGTLNKLGDAHPYGKMLRQAPLAIVVCGDPAVSERYWVQDCSAATENLLLAAVALDLGAVWLGVHPRTERKSFVRKELGIPHAIEPLAIIALGHPAEEKEPRTRFEQEKVHENHW
jgi:nitroreductase